MSRLWNSVKKVGQLLVMVLPWPLKRPLLQACFGYRLHPQAWIGVAWIFPRHLEMGRSARIDHLNVAVHLDRMVLGELATLGRGNWITGYPKHDSRHFTQRQDRDPSLLMGPHSAVTKQHHLDCTDRLEIGAFATVAGYASQFLTHSIDVDSCRQDCAPIRIGSHCLVGTNVVVLGGSVLPDRSVLGAKALLNKAWQEPCTLYAGVPARPVKTWSPPAAYFCRATGFVE